MVDLDGTTDLWEEPERPSRTDIRKQAVRWAFLFGLLLLLMCSALWWASSAVRFGAARMDGTAVGTYKVVGNVVDLASGRPVAWAHVGDDPSGKPPLYHTLGDKEGRFELLTIAEPHTLVITAVGYKQQLVRVGKPWYIWMPSGSETIKVRLETE